MKLRDTWKREDDGAVVRCIWCHRDATLCVIEAPCDGRISFEEELRIPHGVGCGCFWCLPVRPGISPPPSTEAVRRMDNSQPAHLT